jgi:hypothetical protein
MPVYEKYPLPCFLEGIITPSVYYKFLASRARTLLFRDRKRNKPFAVTATKAQYRSLIHDAVMRNGQTDPYTGETLDWGLIGAMKEDPALRDIFEKKFALMPTVDHIDPDKLEFAIVSLLVNSSKSDMTPKEYRALCQKVVAFQKRCGRTKRSAADPDSRLKKFLLPQFLAPIMTVRAYNKWLDNNAHKLFLRDKKRGKQFAFTATQAIYKSIIHRAVSENGQYDPYTGETLRWDLVGEFDNTAAHEIGDAYKKKFYLMPTIDHTDPDVLGLEICSWLVNECKTFLNGSEFVALCRKVALT